MGPPKVPPTVALDLIPALIFKELSTHPVRPEALGYDDRDRHRDAASALQVDTSNLDTQARNGRGAASRNCL